MKATKGPYLLFILLLLASTAGILLAVDSVASSKTYGKDFVSNYVLARAVRANMNPYVPLQELVDQLNIPLTGRVFLHPSPHPPALALFSLPLAWLPYEYAAVLWLLFEMLCLAGSAVLLARWWSPKATPFLILIFTLAAFAWPTVWEDLMLGQFNTVLLLLLILNWRLSQSTQARKQIWGGLFLGLAIALKITAWPLLIFLVIRRYWANVITATATIAAVNLLACAVMGWTIILDYYTRVGPLVASLHRGFIGNLSLWSLGWRLFEGTGSPVLVGITAPPLYFAPLLAVSVSSIVVIGALIGGVVLAAKTKRFDDGYAITICTILLVSPLTWSHYLLILAIPAVVI